MKNTGKKNSVKKPFRKIYKISGNEKDALLTLRSKYPPAETLAIEHCLKYGYY